MSGGLGTGVGGQCLIGASDSALNPTLLKQAAVNQVLHEYQLTSI